MESIGRAHLMYPSGSPPMPRAAPNSPTRMGYCGRSIGMLVIRGTLLSLDFGLAEVNGEWYPTS